MLCVDGYEVVRLTGSPGIIYTDPGSQFASDTLITVVTASGAKVSMDGEGASTDNRFIERFWRSLKVEEVYLRAYETGKDATRWISQTIHKVKKIRPLSSVEGKTPNEFHTSTPAEGLLRAS